MVAPLRLPPENQLHPSPGSARGGVWLAIALILMQASVFQASEKNHRRTSRDAG